MKINSNTKSYNYSRVEKVHNITPFDLNKNFQNQDSKKEDTKNNDEEKKTFERILEIEKEKLELERQMHELILQHRNGLKR